MNKRLLAASAALLCIACMHDPETSGKGWYGLALRTCGPADGPAIEIQIDSLPFASCTTSHVGGYQYYRDNRTLDSLKVGYTDSSTYFEDCQDCKAKPTEPDEIKMKIVVIRNDSAGILVDFRYQRKVGMVHTTADSGRVLLKVCRDLPRGFCG